MSASEAIKDTSHRIGRSTTFKFSPVGKVTTVTARSKWKDPSFGGAFLPVERTVTEHGFTAKWKGLHLNRNYP